MRALISKEQEEKKRKRNQTILVVFLGFIMIASTLGYAIQSNLGGSQTVNGANETKYNGYTFTNQNGLWVLGNYVFRNLPQQVPNIGFGINTAISYQGKPAYIYSENDEAEVEVLANLGQIALRVQRACPSNSTSCEAGLPVKTCNDNFIIIKESNTSSITQDNNCVYIEGTQEQLTALADQFLFKVLGIK